MINHLLFANDSLIFYKASKGVSDQLLSIIQNYALTSRKCINTNKTQMVFTKNVFEVERTEIRAIWGVRGSHLYKRYLGLPPIIRRSRRCTFSKIKANLWQ